MRRLHEVAASNADARLAIQMFCYAVGKQVAAPGGADMLVSTGGIGENDAQARAESCRGLSWIGVKLDPARNRSGEKSVSNRESRCAVRGVASRSKTSRSLGIPGY